MHELQFGNKMQSVARVTLVRQCPCLPAGVSVERDWDTVLAGGKNYYISRWPGVAGLDEKWRDL